MLLDLKALRDYGNWIGETAWDVRWSVMMVGGWQQVFPGALPRWASRIRQYFNQTPMTLKLLDHEKSSRYLERAQTALPSARAEAIGKALRREPPGGEIGTIKALSGAVYEDAQGRSIWFQMSPGGAIYHFGEKIWWPTLRSIEAALDGQEHAPVFKLVCPDRTGGSREVCIENPFGLPSRIWTAIGASFSTTTGGHATIGAVNEVVNVANRIVKDSVAQGSYNYAETVVTGLPAHERLDVQTDPRQPGYYVEPPDQFAELYMRRFPENDPKGKSLAAQTAPAP